MYETLIVLLQLVLLTFSLQAQTINTPPAITWQKTFGGSENDLANCVKPTSDGGFIVAGITSSNDGDMSGNHGTKDCFLAKLNDSGNLIWQHCYGGTGMEEAVAVVQTPDGGYAMGGKTSSNNGDVTVNYGKADYWLAKTDEQGMMQWQRSYGGSLSDVCNDMQLTSDNGFVMAGTSYSNDDDVSGNHGQGDAWIIKLDQDGNLQWQKIFGGSQFDKANSVQQTTDGGYIVAGYSLSGDGDVLLNRGQEDFWFFKLDANGNLQWQKTMGGSGGDCGSGVQQTLDGGYLVCGLTHSLDHDVVGIHGYAHDMWLVKVNSSGVPLWTKCLGGSNSEDGVDVRQRADGTIIACAYSTSTNGDVSGNHGSHDIWLTALNNEGTLLWQKSIGGSQEDYPHSLEPAPGGQFIVAGATKSNNGDIGENKGGFDCWVIKLTPGCNNIFYADADSDGYGNSQSFLYTCIKPPGYSDNQSDCSDNNSSVYPGATEACNELDDNCNGMADEGLIFTNYYADGDHDGFGSDSGIQRCSNPGPGFSENNTDCNDVDSMQHPGAEEICNNSLDDNCNGEIDDCAIFNYYADHDSDSYGDASDLITTLDSVPPAGFVADYTDCNDNDPLVHMLLIFYEDGDGDGFGSLVTLTLCASDSVAPQGFVADNTDCNDNDPLVHVLLVFYEDGDGDSFGSLVTLTLCASNMPAGYSFNNTDCNDADSMQHPGEPEICNNSIDDNCSGETDECGMFTYYADHDSDLYGAANDLITTPDSAPPPGFVVDSTDCNDDEPLVHAARIFYEDGDGDGFGSLITATLCVAIIPAGYSLNNFDCNDSDSLVHSAEVFYPDNDGDGFGSLVTELLCTSALPNGYSFTNTDCNDYNTAIHPGASETCNELDDDCDGTADNGLAFITYFIDTDLDGFGSSATEGTLLCSQPEAGYSLVNTDCDDSDSEIHPGATEACNSIDDNCNNQIDDGTVSATISPSGNIIICSGSSITLYAATGTGITYKWKKNGANIPGATSSSYIAKLAASFTVMVSSGSCSVTSEATNISISPKPAATITPSGTISYCAGISLTMNANTGSGLTYQWQKGNVNISGATNSSYVTPVTGSYKVIVTNGNGCSKTSPITTLSNYTAASVQVTNTGNLNICSTGAVILSAKIMDGYTYQWFKDNAAMSCATQNSFVATQPGTYYYQATTSQGCSALSGNKVVTGCKLENEIYEPSSISVFPNPADGNFNIELHIAEDLNGIARIELFTNMGHMVIAENADINEGRMLHSINLKDKLPAGLYLVQVRVNGQVFVKSLLCEQ